MTVSATPSSARPVKCATAASASTSSARRKRGPARRPQHQATTASAPAAASAPSEASGPASSAGRASNSRPWKTASETWLARPAMRQDAVGGVPFVRGSRRRAASRAPGRRAPSSAANGSAETPQPITSGSPEATDAKAMLASTMPIASVISASSREIAMPARVAPRPAATWTPASAVEPDLAVEREPARDRQQRGVDHEHAGGEPRRPDARLGTDRHAVQAAAPGLEAERERGGQHAVERRAPSSSSPSSPSKRRPLRASR